MSVFDIKPDWLKDLTPVELEELVCCLCEAEVVSRGGKRTDVRRQGNLNAPDDGVDINIEVSCEDWSSEFLPSKNVAIQVKHAAISAAQIRREMVPKRALRNSIAALGNNEGCYIIISSESSPDKKQKELQDQMAKTVENTSEAKQVHVAFYNGNKLCQWIGQHFGVLVWVREKMNRPITGWKSFEQWGKSQKGIDNKYIMSGGVEVTIPGQGTKSTKDALDLIRKLVSTSSRPVRMIGLSGVGKTRFVRALFEMEYGSDALDSSRVAYMDAGVFNSESNIDPMIESLSLANNSVILVIDNCSSKLHYQLTGNGYIDGKNIKLITIEYDITDDRPNSTEVVMMRTNGSETAEKMLCNTHADINPAIACRIAEFAEGNAQLSLVLADGLENGDSLANLQDGVLFTRLFHQNKDDDNTIIKHAEVLSLVYSFRIEEGDKSELSALASIIDVEVEDLKRTIQSLLERQIAQARGKWRAILPQPIANRLASKALEKIGKLQILNVLEKIPENTRLLESFAHRLGFLHDSAVAKEIVQDWLDENGLLGSPFEDYHKQKIFAYMLPVADPNLVIQKLETEIESLEDAKSYDSNKGIVETLILLAYEDKWFEKCVRLLITLFQQDNNCGLDLELIIANLFRPYLSETQAKLETRLKIVREMLNSEDAKLETLGLRMIEKSLEYRGSTSFSYFSFGARHRDYGLWPDEELLFEWLTSYIDLAVNARCDAARTLLAKRFRDLWAYPKLQNKLVTVFTAIGQSKFWLEGYKAVRKTIYYDYQLDREEGDRNVPKNLSRLLDNLKPVDLTMRIMEVLQNNGFWLLEDEYKSEQKTTATARSILNKQAESLGRDYAQHDNFNDVFEALKERSEFNNLESFGRGIADSNSENNLLWRKILSCFCEDNEHATLFVLKGLLSKIQEDEPVVYRAMLDEAAANDKLRNHIVLLHRSDCFDSEDLDRCIGAFDNITSGWGRYLYNELFWRKEYEHLRVDKLLELGEKLLKIADGEKILLDAISMRVSDKQELEDEFQKLGLIAATKRVLLRKADSGGETVYQINKILYACYKEPGANQSEKMGFQNAIAKLLDYPEASDFKNVIRTIVKCDLEYGLQLISNNIRLGTEMRPQLHNAHFYGKQLFDGDVDMGRIFRWCNNQGDHSVWLKIAGHINLFETTGQEGIVTLTKPALQLLEACPDPDKVFEIYAGRIYPTVSFGSLADAMEKNAAAFKPLLNHKRQDIAAAAEKAIALAASNISNIRKGEQQRNGPDSNGFE